MLDLLERTSDYKKNLQENLGNITAKRNSFEKVQRYPDLNKYLQHRSNKDQTKK